MQTNKSEKIIIQTLQQFFGDENINNKQENTPKNNKDNNNGNFSNTNNNLCIVSPKGDNFNSDSDENTINKTLTFQGAGENLVDFDFILNTPPTAKNNNLNNLYKEEKNENRNLSIYSGIIDNYYNINSDAKLYDYTLLEKCEKDKLTKLNHY